MSPLYWTLWTVAATAVVLPVTWAWRKVIDYWWRMGRPPASEAARPLAAVILPVRGADPSLSRCIRGLLRQEYPRYQVHIVIDHESDPANEVVNRVVGESQSDRAEVRVSILRNPRETCSLKVSAQLQAISELDDEVEVIVFVDADSIPAEDWLESLVAPLADPQVGTTTGMRWFAPSERSWGSLVRHMFNAGSQSQMLVFQIPWGGSMAMRRDTMHRAKLPDHWSRCFCEDTSSYGPLDRLGYRNVWVSAATQFNEESLELAGAARFIFRQLYCVRLHTARWPSLLLQNLANALALFACTLVAIVAAMKGSWDVSIAFGGLVIGYLLIMTIALVVAERLFRGNMRQRLGRTPPYPPLWRLVPAIILAQALSMYYLCKCQWARRVDWRGVRYEIDEHKNVRLQSYEPFVRSPALVESRSVL